MKLYDTYLYLIVNGDYGFTLQPALILAAADENDTDEVIIEKMKVISKYLTKVLSWRVWNHWMISQSMMEAPIYNLCKEIRCMSLDALQDYLNSDPIELPKLNNAPTLNQQNRYRLRVLLALITEIVARESGESNYLLNKKEIEVEHIWADHYEEHADECADMADFEGVRNNLGDLLLLPKGFNSSYGDDAYEDKVVQYFSQNILAQTLNPLKYKNNFSPERPLSDYKLHELIVARPGLEDRYYEDKTVIFGHTPTERLEKKGRMVVTDTWIDIDTGAGHGGTPMLLRLDDLKAFYV